MSDNFLVAPGLASFKNFKIYKSMFIGISILINYFFFSECKGDEWRGRIPDKKEDEAKPRNFDAIWDLKIGKTGKYFFLKIHS